MGVCLFHAMLIVESQWMNGWCRWRFGYLPVSRFDFIPCFWCYRYYPTNLFPDGKPVFTIVDFANKMVQDNQTGSIFFLDPNNKSTPMYEAFANENQAKKWVDCCQAAKQCCDKMQKDPFPPEDERNYCPRTWDGWQCWPDTKPGVIATSVCPDYIYFTTKVFCSEPAEKECLKNGTWKKDMGAEWTNYGPCGLRKNHHSRIYFHLGCLGVSIAFLIPAIIIFTAYERLRVHRIYIHINLFVSLLLSAISGVILKSVVILNAININSEESIMSRNAPWCKFLSLLTKYFRLTNYSWMFCEGFYLHKLIAAAFAEERNLYKFYILGWGFPLIPVITYSVIRAVIADTDCWTVPTGVYEWITHSPMLLALGLNLIFLCNINRVLFTKLQMKNNSREPTQYRKAVRATLVLIPLFGLHSIMAIYRPSASACKLSDAYSFINDALDGLQGLIVSVIFCYTNNEILNLLKQTYKRRRLTQGSQRASTSTRTLSLSGIRQSMELSVTSYN